VSFQLFEPVGISDRFKLAFRSSGFLVKQISDKPGEEPLALAVIDALTELRFQPVEREPDVWNSDLERRIAGALRVDSIQLDRRVQHRDRVPDSLPAQSGQPALVGNLSRAFVELLVVRVGAGDERLRQEDRQVEPTANVEVERVRVRSFDKILGGVVRGGKFSFPLTCSKTNCFIESESADHF